MVILILLLIQILFAFSGLNTNHPRSALYKNYIIFNKDNYIAYSKLQNLNHQIIISLYMTDFCLQNDFLAVWNRSLIHIYSLYENQKETTINLKDKIQIQNDNFTNITISSQYFVAQYQNESLYVYKILNKKEKILNQTFNGENNSFQSSMVLYQYDSNLAFIYLNTDNKFHIVYLGNEIIYPNDKILFSTQNELFSVQYWNNGTTVLKNFHLSYTSFYQFDIFRYPEDQKITIKYLFSFQDNFVFTIFTNKEICSQYYDEKLQTMSNDILCMEIKDEYLQIQDVNFNQGIQILLKHNQTNQLAIDYYNQCLLSSMNSTKYQCSLCLNENCQNECHTIKLDKCNDSQTSKPSFLTYLKYLFEIIVFYYLLFAFYAIKYYFYFVLLYCICYLVYYTLYSVYQLLSNILNVVQQLCCRLLECMRYIKRKYNNRKLLQQQTCPICLGDVIDPKFFPCYRHVACQNCFMLYEATFVNSKVKCPFRDG